MRIAQLAPLYESVPPRLYGGTERVVYYLTEELVRQGHDVTLYASGDSRTSARLRYIGDSALRLRGCSQSEALAQHLLMTEWLAQDADEFDIVHCHLDGLPFSLIRAHSLPAVTTLHGRLDLPETHSLFREFDDMCLISISNAQRAPVPWASWFATVYHGLPENLYALHEQPGQYLAFLGRISPEKRVDRAIEIARRVGMPLRIAAKVDAADRDYFEQHIEPLLDDPLVEFIGEISEPAKAAFLGNAWALLFPIDWPEPFGLVIIEAMACGTPVIAFPCGSVPEILEDEVTGYIVKSVEEAADAVRRIPLIDRKNCRAVFEERFSVRRMCEGYLDAYERVLEQRRQAAGKRRGLSLAS